MIQTRENEPKFFDKASAAYGNNCSSSIRDFDQLMTVITNRFIFFPSRGYYYYIGTRLYEGRPREQHDRGDIRDRRGYINNASIAAAARDHRAPNVRAVSLCTRPLPGAYYTR